ncbi:hypothetical protein RHMOL_Rhmol08G0312000 [Rhododendron molle]|uniref:Uncharacterized protein n=1 Tax=Rhododendron molle TaxID=49168 RepID=A0ACC0MV47_RHOML|nr:hypothetical protein RHMOL_Rhmol08G0312000 [Rhododendron molle]
MVCRGFKLSEFYICNSNVKEHQNGNYALIKDVEDIELGKFDKRLPCCGCGIGWFCLLLGFLFPLTWYYATILYFGNYYHRDPRERAGLEANAIAVSFFFCSASNSCFDLYHCSGGYSCCYSVDIVLVAAIYLCSYSSSHLPQ